MCVLHDHIVSHPHTTGSYFYHHGLKTAFLQHETCCSATQTDDLYLLGREPPLEHSGELQQPQHTGQSSECNSMSETSVDSFVKAETLPENVNSRINKSSDTSLKLMCSFQRAKIADKNKDLKPSVHQCNVSKIVLNNKTKQIFVCEICQKAFSRKHTLRKHQSLKHKKELNVSHSIDKHSPSEQKDRPIIETANVKQKLQNKVTTSNHISRKVKPTITPDIPTDSTSLSPSPGAAAATKRTRRVRSAPGRLPRNSTSAPLGSSPHTCELCGYVMPRSKVTVHMRLHTGMSYMYGRSTAEWI